LVDWLAGTAGTLIAFGIILALAAAPALVALARGRRPSKYGVDWGPQRKVLVVGISLVLVFVLMLLFGYIYTSSSTWPDWLD